jgi:hypothetical protein
MPINVDRTPLTGWGLVSESGVAAMVVIVVFPVADATLAFGLASLAFRPPN